MISTYCRKKLFNIAPPNMKRQQAFLNEFISRPMFFCLSMRQTYATIKKTYNFHGRQTLKFMDSASGSYSSTFDEGDRKPWFHKQAFGAQEVTPD